MYAKTFDDFSRESIRYTEFEGGNMYYVQIINPTDKEIYDVISGKKCETTGAIGFSGGMACL